MSDEGQDLGLYNLSRPSDSVYSISATPLKSKPARKMSYVSIFHEEDKRPIKSPSNPDLLKSSPKGALRKLSRSNTLPRLTRSDSNSSRPDTNELEILSMEHNKVQRLRRWILALIIGK